MGIHSYASAFFCVILLLVAKISLAYPNDKQWAYSVQTCNDRMDSSTPVVAGLPVCVYTTVTGTASGFAGVTPELVPLMSYPSECFPTTWVARPIDAVNDMSATRWSLPIFFPCEGEFSYQIRSAGTTPSLDPVDPIVVTFSVSMLTVPDVLDELLPIYTGGGSDGEISVPLSGTLSPHYTFQATPVRFLNSGKTSSGVGYVFPIFMHQNPTQGDTVRARTLPASVRTAHGELLSVTAHPGCLIAVTTKTILIAKLPTYYLLGADGELMKNYVKWEELKIVWPNSPKIASERGDPYFTWHPISHSGISYAPHVASRGLSNMELIPIERTGVETEDEEPKTHLAIIAIVHYAGSGSGIQLDSNCRSHTSLKMRPSTGMVSNGETAFDFIAAANASSFGLDYSGANDYVGVRDIPVWSRPITRGVLIFDDEELD